jgi:5-dehydro-2-deoxygluconokinase
MFQSQPSRALDVICLGRVGVDLYAVQKNLPLEEVTQFNKSVGGSPANIATAVARLGGKSGVISLVANDGLGRYVRQFLQSNGVDTRCLGTSPARQLTSLALTEICPTDCQVVIYRQNAADLQLSEADIDPQYIASSRVLLITGTALSAQPSRQASFKAIACARAAGTRVVLDLDYRPYGWVSHEEAAQILLQACEQSDMLIGNEEEFSLLQKARPENSTLKGLLSLITEVVVLKQGSKGCQVFLKQEEQHTQGVYSVTVQKPMGSGDAFAGALLWALCNGQAWAHALSSAAAAAAINVSQDTCADAMPTRIELEKFMLENKISETAQVSDVNG